MAVDTDIKEFVHERFRRTDAKIDRVIELLTGFALRGLGSLEQQLASLRTEVALREDFVRPEHRIDRLDSRVAHIEKRLGLVEA